jgi:AcrR family transcriptional regulator
VGTETAPPASPAVRHSRIAPRARTPSSRGSRIATTAQPKVKTSPGRRTRARRGEGERLREEILNAAADLLAETGDEQAVSIRAIADAVGVTPPSIYLHFADKDSLLQAVCDARFAELDAVISTAAQGADDPVEALTQTAQAYVRFGLENPEHYRLLFMDRPNGVQMPDGDPREANGFRHVVHLVQDCIDRGVFRPMDPFLGAITLWAAVHGITSLLISKREFPWPDLDVMVEHMSHALLDGMLSR